MDYKEKNEDYDYLDALTDVVFKLNKITRKAFLEGNLKYPTYSKIEDARIKVINAMSELENERNC